MGCKNQNYNEKSQGLPICGDNSEKSNHHNATHAVSVYTIRKQTLLNYQNNQTDIFLYLVFL